MPYIFTQTFCQGQNVRQSQFLWEYMDEAFSKDITMKWKTDWIWTWLSMFISNILYVQQPEYLLYINMTVQQSFYHRLASICS